MARRRRGRSIGNGIALFYYLPVLLAYGIIPAMSRHPLYALLDLHDLKTVWDEAFHLNRLMSPRLTLEPIQTAFADLQSLFAGRYPGYRACNTQYHDIHHTTDTWMATLRLMHGATVQGVRFSDHELILASVAALFHDAGYLQTSDDIVGTGAKYTASHIERSIEFLNRYFNVMRFPTDYPRLAASLLHCTGLNVNISAIHFASTNLELLGKMLGAGDLIGQMADRVYLEKLPFLFYEFKEGRIRGYESEFDLLKKTLIFNETTQNRLATDLGGVNRFMRPHFKERWGVDEDLYDEAIRGHMEHLKLLIAEHPRDYRSLLRRGGLAQKLDLLYAAHPRP